MKRAYEKDPMIPIEVFLLRLLVENEKYSEGVIDFVTMIGQYSNFLGELLEEEIVKEKLQTRISEVFSDSSLKN